MSKSKIALLLAAMLAAGCAGAADPSVEAAIKKAIEPRLGPGVKIYSVKATPYAGLYEVRAAGDILYTDKKGEYLIIGHVYNAKTAEDITKGRIDEINKIKFSDLPFESALKVVKGDGKRVIAVFEDPNCGYCKRFRQTTLKEMDNVTVYTFMYNILSDDSSVKSKNIWCAPDRRQALTDAKLGKPVTRASCANPVKKQFQLGEALGVHGTPAVYLENGKSVGGYISPEELLHAVKENLFPFCA